ncbi:uncharacterized protein METZ01_LOCUS421015, partial [marine metagenome]
MTKVNALVCNSISEDLSGISLDSISLPNLNSNDVLVKVKAASVNFPDLLMSQGKYQHKPNLPFVLGMEGSGVIEDKGKSVNNFKLGDEVMFGSWDNGAFAEQVILPE